MAGAASVVATGDSFRGMTSGTQVLDALEEIFRSFGASHFLATGLPLPGRSIDPLILRANWVDQRPDRSNAQPLRSDDSLLHVVVRSQRPIVWANARAAEAAATSGLMMCLDSTRDARAIAVPVCAFLPYQAMVLAAGPGLSLETRALLEVDYACIEAFRRLIALGFVRSERPGDLSARERRVVELSAAGKTASDIAEILDISQRTVHAHLQNASEKLGAANKTHTVVEALRYGQISA
jgi:DNA-binding CsgD family transcriptional regulator